jgi:DNA-binding transcriptional LysR family regulator
MLEELRGLVVFAHVAETRSFSRAAERLNVTKSAVSKQIAQLEVELGVQLLVRTTRKLVLTEVGERVYASCARIAGEVEAARDAAQTHSTVVAGQLRVTAPAALGRNFLMPLVKDFLAQHPGVSIELVLGDSFVDLVDDRIDVALRVGGRADASQVTRKVARVEMFILAAPAYLEKHGTPRSPRELLQHEWIMHGPSVGVRPLHLYRGTRRITLRPHGRLLVNDGQAGVAVARAGHGLIVAPDFEAADDFHSGALVRVLPSYRLDDAALHLVFPPRRHVLGKVRAFSDFVAERFAKPPWHCPKSVQS